MKTRYSLACCFSLGLLLTACAAPAAPRTADVTAVQPTPASVASIETRLRASLVITNPDELAFANGFVWVKTDDGRVVQVDPSSDAVIGAIKVDTTQDVNHYCQGLSTDGQTLWACSARGEADQRTIDVVRIDPHSRQVIATVAVHKIFDQRNMPILLGRVWVLAGDSTQLVGVDLATNQAQQSINLGAHCLQLAASGATLIAACPRDNLVLRIDPATGQVIARATVEVPRGLAANARGIWVAQDSGLVRLDPQTLRPVAKFAGLPDVGLTGDLFVTDAAVWVRVTSGFLYRIDPTNNTFAEQVRAEPQLSGGSVLALADSLWTTAYNDARLFRLTIQ